MSDEIRQPRDGTGFGDLEAGTEIVPERHGKLGAGLEQAEEGITRLLAGFRADLAGDLALGDEAADGVLRAVAVQGISGRSSTKSSCLSDRVRITITFHGVHASVNAWKMSTRLDPDRLIEPTISP